MSNFKGCSCDACGKMLTENDDIVVCPICGTPYHRACYSEKGMCMHEDEHKSGYEFKRGPIMHDDCTQQQQHPDSITCPQCSTANSSKNIFCQHCGQPIHTQSSQFVKPQGGILSDMSYLTGLPPIDKDDEIDGIAVRDWMEYTGASGPYYIFQFKSMDATKRKTSICWSAVFFPYFYFFYRKMWLCGIVAGLVSILTAVPSFLALFNQAGIIELSISVSFLTNLSAISSILSTVFNMACGMFAIYLYRLYSGKIIRNKKEKLSSKEAFSAWLQKSSGPSKIGLGVAIASLFLLSYSFTYFIGVDNLKNLMTLALM